MAHLLNVDDLDPNEQKALATLEEHVTNQVRNNTYDYKANRFLLKAYLYTPDTVKVDSVQKILVKALMQLPNTDFVQCCCLVPERLRSEKSIQNVLKLADLLESTDFVRFWQVCEPDQTVSSTPGFKAAIVDFVMVTVKQTYTNISTTQLLSYFPSSEKDNLDALLAKHGCARSSSDANLIELGGKSSNFTNPSSAAPVAFSDVTQLLF
jgi:translation initiation factor 3 subunit K